MQPSLALGGEGRIIVTENARDFANVETCTVLLGRKRWWLGPSLARKLATALDLWAEAHPEPGLWAYWLHERFR